MIKLKEGQQLISIDGNTYLTEKNDVLLERDTSINHMTDVGLVDKLVEFIKSNPFPTDEQFHAFAKDNDLDPDDVEQYAYAMLSIILTGGKSKGYDINNVDEDNYSIGYEIEKEHVELDTTNEVITRMQMYFQNKIRNDHLFETNTYYTDGVDFIQELKKESQD